MSSLHRLYYKLKESLWHHINYDTSILIGSKSETLLLTREPCPKAYHVLWPVSKKHCVGENVKCLQPIHPLGNYLQTLLVKREVYIQSACSVAWKNAAPRCFSAGFTITASTFYLTCGCSKAINNQTQFVLCTKKRTWSTCWLAFWAPVQTPFFSNQHWGWLCQQPGSCFPPAGWTIWEATFPSHSYCCSPGAQVACEQPRRRLHNVFKRTHLVLGEHTVNPITI